MPPDDQKQTGQPGGETPNDFEAYIASQPDPIKELYKQHTAGWRSTLENEREKATNAINTVKELREAVKTADAATAEKLTKLAAEKDAEIELARQEATFYRDAAAAGCPPGRLERAWRLFRNGEYPTRRGEPDVAAMKADVPELFVPARGGGANAGAGTGAAGRPAVSMDNLIRAAAGKR